jgi:hypothetical protein
MINIRNITNERQFKSSTGFDKETFQALLGDFTSIYKEKKGKSYEDYILENLRENEISKFKTLEEILFFVLFQKKNDLIWDCLGVVFDMSGSRAHFYFNEYLHLLEEALEKKSDATS